MLLNASTSDDDRRGVRSSDFTEDITVAAFAHCAANSRSCAADSNCAAPSRDTLSIITFELRAATSPGSIRALAVSRRLHYKLSDVSTAFVSYVADDGPSELDATLKSIL